MRAEAPVSTRLKVVAIPPTRAGGIGSQGIGGRITMQGFDQLFTWDPLSLGLVVFRTVAVYTVLLIGLRLAGKRELGQMSPFDLVVLLVISNSVQNAMIGPDTSLNAGLLAAFTLLVLNWAVDSWVTRNGWFRKSVIGTPTLLVSDGKLIPEHLRREGVTSEEVLQALREHGVDDLSTVKMAVLEVDGSISVVPASAQSSRTRHRLRGRKRPG